MRPTPFGSSTGLPSRAVRCLTVAVLLWVPLSACDESGADAELGPEREAMPLSALLGAEIETGPGGTILGDERVEHWIAVVDKELAYAEALEAHWTVEVREAVGVATAARSRVDGAHGQEREAAIAEARQVLDDVSWTAWTATLIECVEFRITADDVAEARDSRSSREPAWRARVRRADRLKNGAAEASREKDARRSLQRAFYACELARQIAEFGSESARLES